MSPLMCMAVAVFFEARGETLTGKYAVANVIMNRVASQRYPDDVCDVVNQDKQFSYTHDGLSDDPELYNQPMDEIAWEESKIVSEEILKNMSEFVIESTHYHADYVTPYWSTAYEVEARVGKHIFYK